MRATGRTALELAGIGVDDVGIVDLYSCFPSAVEIAANEIGLPIDDPSRPLTVTGGLSFAGGPWNNYVTHAIATMADRLREAPAGTYGLCTANGGFITKHAMGVYGNEPPAAGFKWQDVQDEVDRAPTREAVGDHDGEAVVETWTVMHDREGQPENGLAAMLIPDGRRAWATTQDPDALKVLLTDDMIGRTVHITADGALGL
jgi:acetyl-CoA C-acetyltransferase